MMDMNKVVGPLHKVYEDLSGLPVELSLNRIFAWERWKAKGWTEDDLRLVLSHIKNRSRSYPVWAKIHMMFTKLIADTENFAELLSEARAMARIRHVEPGKAKVLRATRRPADPQMSTEKTPEQIIRESEALKKLLEVRDSL